LNVFRSADVERCVPGYLSQHSDSLRFGRSGGSNPGEGEIFCARPDRLWAPPSFVYNAYLIFPPG